MKLRTATSLFDVEAQARSDVWRYLLNFARTAERGRADLYFLQAARDIVAANGRLRAEFAPVFPRAIELADRLAKATAVETGERSDGRHNGNGAQPVRANGIEQ